jgi:hypothetical protein
MLPLGVCTLVLATYRTEWLIVRLRVIGVITGRDGRRPSQDAILFSIVAG